MGCKKIEKWVSNNIDGELPEKKKKILEAHLKRCSSCSSYQKIIERIHKETKSLEMPEVSPAYREEFTSRVKTKISFPQPEKRIGAPLFSRWKWAWTAAALIFVIVVGSVLYLTQSRPPQEVYIFSFENSLAQIYQEIGSDSELEDLFNSVILASIGETLEDSGWIIRPDFYEDSLLWDNLTEEEMRFLESEIKKDTKL